MKKMVLLSSLLALFTGANVVGNTPPIADAGSSRYAGIDPVVLDGTGSYDPEGGNLSYQWQQVSGPAVVITGAGTATPTINGFVQTSSIQENEFELVVSDGDLTSEPDVVKVIIVPSFGSDVLQLTSQSSNPAKPFIVAFGGGNCSTGGGMDFGGEWTEKANWITVSSYSPPYERYGDMLMTFFSVVAPDYTGMIQIMGFSTGNLPAMTVANHINQTYQDRRFAVNRVTLLDAVCSDLSSQAATFMNNPVDGEPAWVDNYKVSAANIPGA